MKPSDYCAVERRRKAGMERRGEERRVGGGVGNTWPDLCLLKCRKAATSEAANWNKVQ